MVVISTIAILVALLLPNISLSRRQARLVICLANLDQLHTAQIADSDDRGGRTKRITHALGNYWHHALGKNLGDPTYAANPNQSQWKRSPMSVLTCPETQRDPLGGFGTVEHVWSWGGGGQGGYGANLWLFPMYTEYDNDWRFPRGDFYPSLNQVGRPSDVPLFGDSNWVGSWPDDTDTVPPSLYSGYAVHEVGYFMGRFSIDRHNKGIQMAFVDGSARRADLEQLWQLQWHRSFVSTVKTVP